MYKLNKKTGNFIKLLFIASITIVLTRSFSGLNNIIPGGSFAETLFVFFSILICYIYNIVKISITKDISTIYNNKNILLLLIMWFAISIYSDDFMRSMYSVAILGGIFILAITLLDKYSLEEMFFFLTLSFIAISLVNIIFTALYPNIGYDASDSRFICVWRGAFPFKNVTGSVMCLGAIIAYLHFYYNNGNKIKGFLCIILCLTLLLMTKSSTSIAAFAISIASTMIYRKSKRKFNITFVLLCIHVMTYSFLFIGQRYSNYFHLIFNRDMTLTGRTIIWQGELAIAGLRPFFGYGYGVFWFNDKYQGLMDSYVPFKFIGSHNGFTGLLIEVGIIGTFAFILLLLDMGYKLKCIDGKRNLGILFSYAYLTYFMFFMITEQGFVSTVKDYNVFFLMLVFAIINKEYYLKKRKCMGG